MAGVDLVGLRKTWGAVVALEGLDLAVQDEEFLVLLGPRGAGKSTSLRLAAGLDDPTAGHVLIGGQRVTDLPARDRGLALVARSSALYPHMTVADNVGFPLRAAGVPADERRRRVAEAAGWVGLGHLLGRRPGELADNERQGAALARALIRRPHACLMDEPLADLDRSVRADGRADLKNLQRRLGITVLYATRDPDEAMVLGDRIVVLKDGRAQQAGTPAEIYAKPLNTFVAGLIGSPPMNLIPGIVEGDRFVFPAGDLAVPGAPQGPAILGVRPEDLSVVDEFADMAGEVYASEPTGDTTLLRVVVGDVRITAKVGPRDGRAIGARVGLRLPPDERLHHFHGWGDRMGAGA